MKTTRTFFYCPSLNRLLPSKTLTFLLLLFVVSSVFLLNAGKVSACMSSFSDGTLSSCTTYTGVYNTGQVMNLKVDMKDTSGKAVAAYIYFPFDWATYTYSTGVLPGYIASCANSGSCSAIATPNAPMTPGRYDVGFRECGTFHVGGYMCTFQTGPVYILGVGNINVSSNISASWTIIGPATITGSGTSQSSLSKPTGTYTIYWGAKSGYVTPATQTLTLGSGGTISFRGTYTNVPVATCSVSPNPGVDSGVGNEEERTNIVNITLSSSYAKYCTVKVDDFMYWSNYNTSGTLSLSREDIGGSVGSHQAKVSCSTEESNGPGSENEHGINSAWSTCDYTIINAPINGGWSGWSAKNTSCGYSGTQTRTCTNPTPAYGGAACSGSATQAYTNAQCLPTASCSVSPSSVAYGGNPGITLSSTYGYYCYVYKDWSNVNTGYFTSGTYYPGAQKTPGAHAAQVYCYNTDWAGSGWSTCSYTVANAPINGGWSGWSAKNTSCGYSGTQTRSCNNPAPQYGGAACSGSATQAYTNAACDSNITSFSISPNPVPYGGTATISYSCTNGYYSNIRLDETGG